MKNCSCRLKRRGKKKKGRKKLLIALSAVRRNGPNLGTNEQHEQISFVVVIINRGKLISSWPLIFSLSDRIFAKQLRLLRIAQKSQPRALLLVFSALYLFSSCSLLSFRSISILTSQTKALEKMQRRNVPTTTFISFDAFSRRVRTNVCIECMTAT